MNELTEKALALAKEKDQRIGREQYWFITIEQLEELLNDQYPYA